VHGLTSREVYPTLASHVNYVVADTESWEQRAAKVMEDLARRGIIQSYVKNAFLGFRIRIKSLPVSPRTMDLISSFEPWAAPVAEDIRIIVEITGFNQDKQDEPMDRAASLASCRQLSRSSLKQLAALAFR